MGSRAFALKIAFFNAVGFCFTVGRTVYVDPLLTTHVGFGVRTYPLGYWLCAPSVLILISTYLLLRAHLPEAVKTYAPPAILLTCGIFDLFFLGPEFPHGAICVWIPLFGLASGLTCWIRFATTGLENIAQIDADKTARLERVKEAANMWRTISVSMSLAYFALVIPWSNAILSYATTIVRDRAEAMLLSQTDLVILTFYSSYILFGLIRESYKKSSEVADLLLKIKS